MAGLSGHLLLVSPQVLLRWGTGVIGHRQWDRIRGGAGEELLGLYALDQAVGGGDQTRRPTPPPMLGAGLPPWPMPGDRCRVSRPTGSHVPA